MHPSRARLINRSKLISAREFKTPPPANMPNGRPISQVVSRFDTQSVIIVDQAAIDRRHLQAAYRAEDSRIICGDPSILTLSAECQAGEIIIRARARAARLIDSWPPSKFDEMSLVARARTQVAQMVAQVKLYISGLFEDQRRAK